MPDNKLAELKKKGLPGYTVSLLLVFVLPFIALYKVIMKSVQKKPFAFAVGLVCLLGWSWSIILSYMKWWEFPDDFILGFHPIPYLPLEEFLIYPLGGAFSIFLYTYPSIKLKQTKSALGYWIFLLVVNAVFVTLAIVKADTRPYYLYSQFVLYNGICLAFAPFIAKEMNMKGVLVSSGGLGLVGFIWDYFAFQNDWWIYHAITDVRVLNIPVEDFNFYALAPMAAVSLYYGFCKKLKIPAIPKK